MTTVILDAATTRRIREAGGFVEVRDPDGNKLGEFIPLPYDTRLLDPGVTVEELDRREAEGGGRPLSEILRDLAALP